MATVDLPRRRDAEQNRIDILRAAGEAFAVDPAASIDSVARAAGLTRRALYGHFEDRDALLNAVIAAAADRFRGIAQDVADEDPRLALVRLAKLLRDAATHVLATTTLATDERYGAETSAALEPLRVRLREICQAGASTGVLRQDIPADLTARLVEEAARSVLNIDHDIAHANQLVARAVLGAGGLDWHAATTLIDEMALSQ